MFPLNIHNETVLFRDIKPDDLTYLLHWYNKVDEFQYATGIDEPISLETLRKKYAEVSISSKEFYVGIYPRSEENMIGILKGSMKYKAKDAIWISSIVIDPCCQKKGYGSASINLLIDYMKRNCQVKTAYIAVVEDNLAGRRFWIKQDFQEVRKIQSHIKLQRKAQNVIIMCKNL